MKLLNVLFDRRAQLGALITVLILLILGVSFSSPGSSIPSSSSQGTGSSQSSTSGSSSTSSQQAPATVVVSFDSVGGSPVDPMTITNGEINTTPSNPTRDFSNFQGWYYDTTYYYQVDFQYDFIDTPAMTDFTVYAKWSTHSATFQFVYLDNDNDEQLASTQFVPMLSCKDDFDDEQYGLTIPALPTAQNTNEFTYDAWDLSNLPACLNEVAHYNIKIYAPRIIKEYTRTLATPFNVLTVKDIEVSSSLSSVVLAADGRVYSAGANSIFKVPSLNGTVDNSATGVFDITDLIPLNENEQVVDLVAMFTGSNPSFSIRPGMLFLTNQSRILDFGNVTLHGGSTGFVDITTRLSLGVGETIVEMVSGSEFLVTLTSANRVVGLGNLPSYPGTNFNAPTVVNTPSVFGTDPIVDISAGYRSVALRTSTGKAGVFGANVYGQIGLDSNVFSNSPIRLLSGYTNVTLIEATYERIYMVADSGASVQKVFASGLYIYDTLGGNAYQGGFMEVTKFDTANDYYQPLAVGETIVQVAGLPLDTLFMTSTGRILSIGPNINRITYENDITNTTNPAQLNATTLRDTADHLGAALYNPATDRFLTMRGLSSSEAVFYVISDDGSILGNGINRRGLLGSTIFPNSMTEGFVNIRFSGWKVLAVDTIAWNTGFSLPDPTPIPGFTFAGWSLTEDGPIHLQPGGTTGINMPAYNLILYARYFPE